MDQNTNPIPAQNTNPPADKLNRFVIGALLFVICIISLGYTYIAVTNFLKPDAVSTAGPQRYPLSEEERGEVLAGLEDLKNRVSNERALKILDELDSSPSKVPLERQQQVIGSL